jgi:peptidoglycan hydrolase-like protein with peptidoglycan-binding domain
MLRRVIFLCVIFVFLISLSGCATARKQKDLEIQGLRNQISVLETQIQAKDEEINNLRDALSKTEVVRETKTLVVSKKKVILEVKSRPKIKQVQMALRNAGYNPGAVDGRMGKQTRDAIRAFQRANNLPVDGKVGKKTWNLLKGYLYKKVK